MNSLPIRKIVLYILLVAIGFFIWRTWQMDSARHKASAQAFVATKTHAPTSVVALPRRRSKSLRMALPSFLR